IFAVIPNTSSREMISCKSNVDVTLSTILLPLFLPIPLTPVRHDSPSLDIMPKAFFPSLFTISFAVFCHIPFPSAMRGMQGLVPRFVELVFPSLPLLIVSQISGAFPKHPGLLFLLCMNPVDTADDFNSFVLFFCNYYQIVFLLLDYYVMYSI